MTAAAFQELCAGVSNLAGCAAPTLVPDARGVLAFSFTMRQVKVSVLYAASSAPRTVFLMVEFALAPRLSDDSWAVLMHTNLVVLEDPSPVFGRNPVNGDAVLRLALPIDSHPTEVFQRAVRYVNASQDWQRSLQSASTLRLHDAVIMSGQGFA